MRAFAGDRDYAEAERNARLIVERFPNSSFHPCAVRLVAELPRRRDDFKTFKLPTAEEWAGLQKKLSHAEQIDWLVEDVEAALREIRGAG